MKVLFVVAHPDDEILTFGPTLYQFLELKKRWGGRKNFEVHVIVVTTPDDRNRLTAFHNSCAALGIEATSLGAKDDPEKSIHSIEIVNQISTYIHRNRIETVFTHCPASGDNGRHLHHLETGLMAGCAAFNENVPVDFLYYEGFARTTRSFQFKDMEAYKAYIDHMNVYYGDEYAYISSSSSAYPLPMFNVLYKMDRKDFALRHLGYMATFLSDYENSVLLSKELYGVDDLYFTDSSHFEVRKREKLLALLQEPTQENVSESDKVMLLDVGTGKGLTTFEWFKSFKCQEKRLICFDPYVEPASSDIDYLYCQDIDDVREEVERLRAQGYKLIVSGFQVLYMLSVDEFQDLIDLRPEHLVTDAYIKDDSYALIEGKYDGLNEEHHITGMSDQFHSAAMLYTDSIWRTFLTRVNDDE